MTNQHRFYVMDTDGDLVLTMAPIRTFFGDFNGCWKVSKGELGTSAYYIGTDVDQAKTWLIDNSEIIQRELEEPVPVEPASL